MGRHAVSTPTRVTTFSFTLYRGIVWARNCLEIMLKVDNQESFASVDNYMSRLRDTLSTVIEAVKRHQARASEQQKMSYDFRANFPYCSEGELVWIQNKARKRGVCPKLQRRYKGPFRMMDRVTDVLYRLVPVEGGQESVVHFNQLKPFTSSLAVSSNPSVGIQRK